MSFCVGLLLVGASVGKVEVSQYGKNIFVDRSLVFVDAFDVSYEDDGGGIAGGDCDGLCSASGKYWYYSALDKASFEIGSNAVEVYIESANARGVCLISGGGPVKKPADVKSCQQ